MQPHVKTYLKYYDIGEQDVWMCERCGRSFPINNGLEIHHINFRSRGGKDNIENLACLCHECHRLIHDKGVNFTREDSVFNRIDVFALKNIF